VTHLTPAPAQYTLPPAVTASGRSWRRRIVFLLMPALALGLTACQTKVGEAAVVGNYKISPQQLDKYVDLAATPDGQSIRSIGGRRQFVLQVLIDEHLSAAWLADKKNGGAITDDENATADQTIQQQFQTDDPAKIGDLAKANGYLPSLVAPIVGYLRNAAVVAKRTQASSLNAIGAALATTRIKVSVSSRYGAWSAESASVGDFVPPAFLLPTPAPTPPPQG